MDTYQHKTYVYGQAAAIYKQAAPLVNAEKPSGQWQTYDIIYKSPVFGEQGTLKQPYLRFADSGGYFIKAGPDSPENLLSYSDFDGTFHNDGYKDHLVKTWQPHVQDWSDGDPTWKNGKGKGLIGAINYIASKGMNSISFLTLNIVGDDQNVYPYIDNKDYLRFDVSKLAQWEIVFEHAQKLGVFLHFKT